MPARKPKTKPRKKKARNGTTRVRLSLESQGIELRFTDHEDGRCAVKRLTDRMVLLMNLEAVAIQAIGEHMAVESFQAACMHAWNRAVTMSERMIGRAAAAAEVPTDKKLVS